MKLISAICLLAGKSLAEEAVKELKTVEYATPEVPAGAHLFESFDAGLPASFVKTAGSKQDEEGGKYRTVETESFIYWFWLEKSIIFTFAIFWHFYSTVRSPVKSLLKLLKQTL